MAKITEDVPRIVSATRLHLPLDATEIPEATERHLRGYVESTARLGIVAAIAVNAHEAAVQRIAEEVAPGFKVHVLPVPCWGAFVPALNALLNFAQRCGMKYILYQSLEVRCTAGVLQRLLDHHTGDTLVVGPVLSGHDFKAGEQRLNGRTTPWNTLALWSVRKLALTGFLCIADGLPDVPPSIGKEGAAQFQQNPQEQEMDTSTGPMGSDNWWMREISMGSKARDNSNSVPAGVEEVTAIALLQHLHGEDRARAVLLQLPADLQAQMAWETSWGKDERRSQWHKYKMQSKVSRPAAQLEELFNVQRHKSAPQLSQPGGAAGGVGGSKLACFRRRGTSEGSLAAAGEGQADGDAAAPAAPAAGDAARAEDTHQSSSQFGSVLHYGESIVPPTRVKLICLASCGLFSANSTAVLASAFRHINASTATPLASEMMFVGLLIGGVYLPMPLSLWLTRTVTRRANHFAGLCLFGSFLLLGHVCIVLSQLLGWEPHLLLLLARLVQGLGSGILFQVRFVLASVSTSDQHVPLQSLSFLVSDLGLGLGALLPAATAALAGSGELSASAPELLPSVVLALISLAYLAWVLLAFPRRLPTLSDRTRFPSRAVPAGPCVLAMPGSPSRCASKEPCKEADRCRAAVWLSGTARVFVQSAILPVVALSMRDAQWTGNFRQTFAVAALCLLPMPFEAFVSRLCCTCSLRQRPADGTDSSKLASGALGALALAVVSAAPRSLIGEDGDLTVLLARICELAVLMIILAVAAPISASRLYRLKDAERSIVVLEWMKAYVGRLCGPLFAVLAYSWLGYGPLLGVLCAATAVVTLTA
mmetsp:Transcript_30862/g.98464  ORF Transcript_30862/g.98464 Transcript_30862/m.98464 type:complete len:820 (-) Transcript_30862:90-2549(-)